MNGVKKGKTVKDKPYMVPVNKMKRKVFNPEGDELGNIEEIIVDTVNGRVAFGILSFGGFLGIGEKHYAIPWDMLVFDQDDEKFVLDMDKDELKGKLEEREGFEEKDYPDVYTGPWVTEVYEYWECPTYWTV